MKGRRIIALGLIAMIGVTGCRKSPEQSIVKNKNMDNLIEEAKNFDKNMADMEDMKQYDTYQTTLEDESLKITVNVDARIDIPQTDKMSVIRVEQTPITQEFLDTVRKKLLGDEKLYDGSIIMRRTKKDIEESIKTIKEETQSILADMEREDEKEAYKRERQTRIDEEEAAYKKAPSEFVFDAKESDGKLYKVAERFKQDPENEFYEWQDGLKVGESFFGITDGKNGKYSGLFVMNDKDRGNCLRFNSGRHGYDFEAAYAYIKGTDLSEESQEVWRVGTPAPDEWQDPEKQHIFEDEKLTISAEEARTIAEEFLADIGWKDFQYQDGGLYYDSVDIRAEVKGLETKGCRPVYILRYMRTIDGAMVTYTGEMKYEEGWKGDIFEKKIWPEECIEFRINDDGIVEFSCNAPTTITEKVVDTAGMKPFDEIKEIFEKMVIVKNAQREINQTIDVDRVVLGYTRISEPDSYDTGLYVPVWDFQGTLTVGDGKWEKYESILTVNAIDGTVIDRAVGY